MRKHIRRSLLTVFVLMLILSLSVIITFAVPDDYPIIGSETYVAGADYLISATAFNEVKITDSFWKPILDTNANVTVPMEASHGLTNNNRLMGAMYSLQTYPDAVLQAQVDARVQALAAGNPSSSNGIFETSEVWQRLTGSNVLVDLAVKNADLLYTNFQLNQPPFSGGERDAVNCIQLYRATGDKKHLDLAKHYLDIRGIDTSVNRSRHNQSYMPTFEQSEAVGHAVNCVTLMTSLLDVGQLTGLDQYTNAAKRMWEDTVTKKMYITGGVGSTGNEGFGEPYVLPNIDAYAESCAVFYYATFNHRLFLATGESKYIDVLERGLYNNLLSGISKSGDRFFYVNRLSSAGDGRDMRWEHASLECCPPNLIRFLATMPGYIYAQKDDAVYVNLYISSEASFNVGGKELALTVDSEMPWGGKTTLTVATEDEAQGAIKLRVPGWAQNQVAPGGLYSYENQLTKQTTLIVNGASVSAIPDQSGYVTINRLWESGDKIEIEFPIETRRVVADERVKADVGRVSIERGPIVYCAEWPDVENGKVFDLLLDSVGSAEADNYMGVVLNATARSVSNPATPPRPLQLIPYHLWANRGAGEMSVWLPVREFVPGDVGPAGGYIFYDNPTYARDGWRYLEAAPFDQSNGAEWGDFRKLIPGARGSAIGTGKQNTADMVAGCDDYITSASLCAKGSIFGVSGWFLPSINELAMMYRNLYATGVSDFGSGNIKDNFSYWSSTQQTADMANNIDFPDNGRQHYDDKDYPRRVRAIRDIEVVPYEPRDFDVYMKSAQRTFAAGDSLFVDVMLTGYRNYTQLNTAITYDADLLQFAGYANLNGMAAEVKRNGADRVSVRSVPSLNMLQGAPCGNPVKVVTLEFKVNEDIEADGIVTELMFTSSIVNPQAGVMGAATVSGQALSVTLE